MRRRIFFATAVTLIATHAGSAASWPGLWGPVRNGAATGAPAGISRSEVAWRRPVRGGYSEIAVVGSTAYTMALDSGEDFVIALDTASGRERWRLRVGPTYAGHGGSDDGPISTPAIEGTDLFALGPRGHLIAAHAETGRERWRHDLTSSFGAQAPTWGFAASPLIEGSRVIVPTAGPKSRGLLAFDRASGVLVWSTPLAKTTSYASAVAVTIHGVRQVMIASADVVAAVAPEDGRVLWQHAGPGGTIEVSNSPILLPDNRVLVSNWEQSMLLQIAATGAAFSVKELWRSTRLRSSNGPTIYRDGYLYGFGGSQLLCVDAATGEVAWRERTGAGTVIAIDDSLVFLNQESGELLAGRMSPKSFAPTLRAQVLESGVRAVTGPSYADGQLYIRNLREIVALRLRPS